MVTGVFIVFLVYYLVMLFLLVGWRKALQPGKKGSTIHSISVVVPLRNEAKNCYPVLNSLAAQEYPTESVEYILVDDHSTDDTVNVLEQWLSLHPFETFRLIMLPKGQEGKKAAITEAIKQAKGEIIVTTDADCQFSSDWLKSISHAFTTKTQVVVGPVKLDERGDLFSALQSMEFASLIGVGAATLAWGWPTLCNGANFAYRKSVFTEVGGFSGNDHIASGDDEFLLRKIGQRYPNAIRFNSCNSGIVLSAPAESLRLFIQQRIRWAGKWKSHGVGVSAILAVFIFLFYCCVIVLLPLIVVNFISLQQALFLLLGKFILEGIWIYRVTAFLKIPFRYLSFITLQIIYPVYVIFFALTANFLRVKWRGRKI